MVWFEVDEDEIGHIVMRKVTIREKSTRTSHIECWRDYMKSITIHRRFSAYGIYLEHLAQMLI